MKFEIKEEKEDVIDLELKQSGKNVLVISEGNTLAWFDALNKRLVVYEPNLKEFGLSWKVKVDNE